MQLLDSTLKGNGTAATCSYKPDDFRQLKLSLTLCLSLVLSAVGALANDTTSAFKQGKTALEENRPLAAVELLEKALALEPDSARIRRAFDKAKELALERAARMAPLYEASHYSSLLSLADLCQRIAPDDPRTTAIERLLEDLHWYLEGRISSAIETARTGDIEEAIELLKPLQVNEEHFPKIDKAREEIAFQEMLQKAESSVAHERFEEAFEWLHSAVAKRPKNAQALELQKKVEGTFLAHARPLIDRKTSSSRISDLGSAIVALEGFGLVCSRCQGQLGDPESLREKYNQRLLPILQQISNSDNTGKDFALCSIVAEARSILGKSAQEALKDYCPVSSNAQGLVVGLGIRAPNACPAEDILSRIRSKLPDGTETKRITASNRPTATQDVELAISIQIDECAVVSLGERNIANATSTFSGGTRQLVNAEYTRLESELNNARAEQARLQRAVDLNPQDHFSRGALVGIAFRIGQLNKALRQTSPFIEEAVEIPYSYQTFQEGRGGLVAGVISFVDAQNLVSAPVEARVDFWADGIRGVSPNDSRRLRDQEPRFQSLASMKAEMLSKFEAQIQQVIAETFPLWLAAQASIELRSGNPFNALPHLALLQRASMPKTDPDLVAFKNERLTSIVQAAADIETYRQSLEVFENRLREHHATVADTGRGETDLSRILESALESVVSVRQGDSTGSGFIVSSTGFIITNHHVVDQAGPIEVEMRNGSVFLGSLVGNSSDADLAVLQIRASGLPHLALASLSQASLGQEVFALGNPKGLAGSVSKGIISAKRRLGDIWYVQIDAPLNPGSSGGPLLLADGRVVGVTTWKLAESEGLNFAVASEEARLLFEALDLSLLSWLE